MSGLVGQEKTLFLPNGETIDAFLSQYLQQSLGSKPGTTYNYFNQNFTVLQVLHEILSGGNAGSHTQLIKDNVLTAMGLDATHEVTGRARPNQ